MHLRKRNVLGSALLLAMVTPVWSAKKLSLDDRIVIVRGLMAEYATAKTLLPRSKKALSCEPGGKYDQDEWVSALRRYGPAARAGDLVQITKITIDEDKLVLQINGGINGGRKWYQNVDVGMGGGMQPISQGSNAPGGTTIALLYPDGTPADVSQIKKALQPILDFAKHSASQNYFDALPAPVKAAIKEKRAIEGMDRDQVLLAMGKPDHKIRETKDGDDYEDWIFGAPPGKITFVTFNGSKVVKVREDYAGLGGSVAPPLPPQR